jgi:hypothetical protein
MISLTKDPDGYGCLTVLTRALLGGPAGNLLVSGGADGGYDRSVEHEGRRRKDNIGGKFGVALF